MLCWRKDNDEETENALYYLIRMLVGVLPDGEALLISSIYCEKIEALPSRTLSHSDIKDLPFEIVEK